jgi:hypothetical protein
LVYQSHVSAKHSFFLVFCHFAAKQSQQHDGSTSVRHEVPQHTRWRGAAQLRRGEWATVLSDGNSIIV